MKKKSSKAPNLKMMIMDKMPEKAEKKAETKKKIMPWSSQNKKKKC